MMRLLWWWGKCVCGGIVLFFSLHPSVSRPPFSSSSSFFLLFLLASSRQSYFPSNLFFLYLIRSHCTYSSRCLVSRFNVRVRRSGLMYPSLQKSWRCKKTKVCV